MMRFSRTQARHGAVAIMLVAAVTGFQAVAIRLGGVNLPLLLYYPMLVVVVWMTTFRFGLAATVVSGALVWTLFLSDPSAYTLPLPERLLRLGSFVLFGALACALASALRRAQFLQHAQLRRETDARRRVEALLQSLTLGVLATDRQGRVTYLNERAAELVGCVRDDVQGRRVSDVLRVYDSDGRRVPLKSLEHALEGGGGAVPAQHWLHTGGREAPLPIVGTASPIRDTKGNLDGAVMVLRDARGERVNDKANRMLRAVVDASPDAIVGIAADRRIVSWNPAARRMFGHDARDVLGRDVAMLVAARWWRRTAVAEAFSNMRIAIGPVDLLCIARNGERFRATVAAEPVRDFAREQVALSMTLRPSSDQRQRDRRAQRTLRGARSARKQADTSNRIKDELIATMSHELRTPLNVIYGWVEVLRHSVDANLQQQAIDAIDRSARSLSRMVGDILDASSLATGKLRFDAMPVDLVRIVSDVASAFRSAAETDGIVLETDCPLNVCVVTGDGERLRQMLSNLVSNALKFTPHGGRIKVGLAWTDASAVLTVADTGQGIAEDFMPHVFEAFRRADNSPASSRRGLGLGLSIVRHIVELHGGSVSVTSAGRDLGTTFTVTLPGGWRPIGPMAWAAAGSADIGRPPAMLDGQRVLVVDDDAATRSSLSAALVTLGAEVDVASSGREALRRVARQCPTVVLSDLAMPDGDGFWLLDALRRDSQPNVHDLRVLAVTAHAGLADERRALAAGFDAYLCKPVDLQQLAQAISSAKNGDG
ncbi:PAS domain-containing hybrid sensor histidine kinase/response regulator [Burkholderia sp. NLJ2]|uniref:PAS domain-containing hybrid sensor histidine kinase/response regulator n=1 Tax=Burkholderia sp. NLJ2 TaxID=3090699 RepID=UPI003C6C1FE2